jgi:hypothetical protein
MFGANMVRVYPSGAGLGRLGPADRSAAAGLVEMGDGLSEVGSRHTGRTCGNGVRSAAGGVRNDDRQVPFGEFGFLAASGENHRRNEDENEDNRKFFSS